MVQFLVSPAGKGFPNFLQSFSPKFRSAATKMGTKTKIFVHFCKYLGLKT